jgi:hypothetical protein
MKTDPEREERLNLSSVRHYDIWKEMYQHWSKLNRSGNPRATAETARHFGRSEHMVLNAVSWGIKFVKD